MMKGETSFMSLKSIGTMLLSWEAIIVYEILIFGLLVFFNVKFSLKRKREKQEKLLDMEQQQRQALDAALTNERRRQNG